MGVSWFPFGPFDFEAAIKTLWQTLVCVFVHTEATKQRAFEDVEDSEEEAEDEDVPWPCEI